MLNKVTESASQAMSHITDGATILIGGFVVVN